VWKPELAAPRARRRRLSLWVAAVALLAGLVVGYAPVFDGQAPLRIERLAEAPRHAASRRVILVSIDGLAPRVLAACETPTLRRLAADGASAARAETVVPSVTLTSHASMLSGVGPEAHGVDWNDYRPWR
jgi:hypothetical protein